MIALAIENWRMATTLADRIRAAMASVGLNQAELERQAQFKEGYLSRPLAGERSQLAGDRLARIARVCGVDAVWLMTGEGEMRNASTPPPSASIDRSVADAPAIADDETPLDRAIVHAWTAATMQNPESFTMADMRNAQVAARGVSRLAREGTDLEATARTYLEAARKVRRSGTSVRSTDLATAIRDEAMAMLLPVRREVLEEMKRTAAAATEKTVQQFEAGTLSEGEDPMAKLRALEAEAKAKPRELTVHRTEAEPAIEKPAPKKSRGK